MHGGQFAGRQPENLTAEEWRQVVRSTLVGRLAPPEAAGSTSGKSSCSVQGQGAVGRPLAWMIPATVYSTVAWIRSAVVTAQAAWCGSRVANRRRSVATPA